MSLMESFVHPELLWLLGLAPVGGLAVWLLGGLHRRRAARMFGSAVSRSAAAPVRTQGPALRAFALVGLLVVTLAQPRYGTSERPQAPGAVDVVLCLDISRSMRARDVHPDRLERARSEIGALLDHSFEGRVALVVFAGDARCVTPLTRDRDSFRELLRVVDPDDARVGGSDLALALDEARVVLQGSERGVATVVLLTDGEDLEGRGHEAARRLGDRGIRVHCMGLGTALGARITVRGEEGESYLQDQDGNEVVSSLDAVSLRAIADATGGEWIDVGASERPLVALVERHRRSSQDLAEASSGPVEKENRFQWPLLVALLLCAAAEFGGRRR